MSKKKRRRVFVVYGRNEPVRRAVFQFLEALGLIPLEWPDVLRLARAASPYTGDAVQRALNRAHAVVVVMTPDDLGRLHSRFLGRRDGPDERQLTPQPRQNVVFEASLALAAKPNQTILLEFGPLRTMSDTHGRNVVRADPSDGWAWRHQLRQRLANMGCPVRPDPVNYLTAGEFDTAWLPQPVWETRFRDRFGERDTHGILRTAFNTQVLEGALRLDANYGNDDIRGYAFAVLEATYASNVRVTADLRFLDVGRDPLDHWIGVEVRGSGAELVAGYLVHLRETGGVDLAGPDYSTAPGFSTAGSELIANPDPVEDLPRDGRWRRLRVTALGDHLTVEYQNPVDAEPIVIRRTVRSERSGTVRFKALHTRAEISNVTVEVVPE